MSHLTKTIFGRMYVYNPGHFYKLQNNILNYSEYFDLNNGLYGKFQYEKFKYGFDNKNFKIESNIIIESTKNKDKYVEYYLYKYNNKTITEIHKLIKINILNMKEPSKSIVIDSIPKNILQEMYTKNDSNIKWCKCCGDRE